MHEAVFTATLEVLKTLCDRGTQKEVNMNGNGESFLDPDLVRRIAAVRAVVGDGRMVGISTNATVGFTEDKVKALKEVGLSQLDISPHSPYHARRAIDIIRKVDIPSVFNASPVIDSHNWAGQLEEENSIDVRINIICHPLLEGRGYVLKEGFITPCCYDYKNFGVFGSVFDDDIFDQEIKRYSLCDTCHQRIVS